MVKGTSAPSPQPTRIRSISRAMQVLLYLAANAGSEGQPAKAVARALNWPLATTYHLLNTLVDERLVSKDASRRYYLGPAVGALSEAYFRQTTPAEHLIAPLRRLARDTGESVYLSAWRHGEIIVLATIAGQHAVRVSEVHIGFRGHAHARASGKLLLAHARPDVLDAYLESHRLERLTPRTITSVKALIQELERVRQRGFAIDDEEFKDGVVCLAAPVYESEEAIASYTISVPAERFRPQRQTLTEALLRAAAEASRRTGTVLDDGGEPVGV